MRKSLLEILACPIDKHTPLELFEINVNSTNKSSIDKQDENGITQDELTYNHTSYEKVIVKDGVLFCSRCSRFFPIIDEIPIMLPDELREREKDLQFLLEWETKLPSKIIDHGVPWHIDRKNR